MSYKTNLLSVQKCAEDLIKVNIDEIFKHRARAPDRTRNDNIQEVVDNVDMNSVVIQFLDIKEELREHGFLEDMEMFDLMQIVKKHFIEYDTFEDKINDDNNDEMGHDMMPLEEKYLYEK